MLQHAYNIHHASCDCDCVEQKPQAYPVCAAHGLVLNSTDIASYPSSERIQNLQTPNVSATLTRLPT